MAAIRLLVWPGWTTLLVLLRIHDRTVGHFDTDLLLYMGMVQGVPQPLDEKRGQRLITRN